MLTQLKWIKGFWVFGLVASTFGLLLTFIVINWLGILLPVSPQLFVELKVKNAVPKVIFITPVQERYNGPRVVDLFLSPRLPLPVMNNVNIKVVENETVTLVYDRVQFEVTHLAIQDSDKGWLSMPLALADNREMQRQVVVENMNDLQSPSHNTIEKINSFEKPFLVWMVVLLGSAAPITLVICIFALVKCKRHAIGVRGS